MAENNSSATLLPCPFCGAAARMKPSTRGDYTSIVCNSPCAGPLAIVVPNDQIEAGIAAWNTRAPQAVTAQAPAAVAVPDERWCPDVCPITGREFFMWVTHHESGDDVPTYGGPFDSYTIPTQDKDGSFSCERYDHDFGGWKDWENVGLMLVDDQSFVVAPDNPRYYEIEQFATPALPATGDSSAGDLATESVLIEGVAYTIPEPVALELLRLNIELQLAEVQAEPTDAEIIALNDGEIFFSMSESRFGKQVNPHTQYHTGEPGYLQFARAVLARWGSAPKAQSEVQAEPVAWANWKVGSTSYIPYRTRSQAQASVSQSAIAATQEGPYEVVPLYTAPQAQPADALTQAARDVLAERRRQVEVEGFSFARDDSYTDGELAQAAACYAASSQSRDISYMAHLWPWPNHSWKPGTTRGDLVKAGALILAELERINRARAAMAAAQEGGNAAKEA